MNFSLAKTQFQIYLFFAMSVLFVVSLSRALYSPFMGPI